jgi:O-antigen/teichoic acid export membrane protein
MSTERFQPGYSSTADATSDPLAIHSGHRLARSALWTFTGQVIPLIVGVLALPAIIRGLGTETFGAFQLSWVVLGYFAVFDFGLGRATTKFVAEYVARGDDAQLPSIVGSSIIIQGVLGVAGALVLAALVPLFVQQLFNIPPALVPDVAQVLYLLAAAVPIIVLSTSFTGVLQAVQRFDLVVAVQASSGVATYALPVLALALGAGLVDVVAVVVVARVIALGAYIALAYAAVPALRRRLSFDRRMLRPLVAYGGWITVTSVVSPLMVYLDRLLIGSVLTLAAVAYYTAPYDVVTRLAIIPYSIVPPLFAAFSAYGGAGETVRLERLFIRSAKYLFMIVAPVTLVTVLLAEPGLRIWVGQEFARVSTLPAQILVVAMMVNAMAQLPYATLPGVGRADLPAKFHLLEFPVYAGILWVFLRQFGITGAALAWLTRVSLDAALLYWAALRTHAIAPRRLLGDLGYRLIPPLALMIGVAVGTAALADHPALLVAGSAVAVMAFAIVAWRYALDDVERRPLLDMLRLRPATRKGPV